MKAISTLPGVAGSMAIIDIPDPEIRDHDLLVKVLRVGVCGTDMEINRGMYGTAPTGSDHLVIGHEAFGQVIEVGPQVREFAQGDYVVSSVRRECPHKQCLPCRSDENDMCVTGDYTERGIKSQHGFLSEFYVEHEQRLTRIPVEIENLGVLLEPLSIVEKAMRQTFKIQERLPWKIENAVVLGAGTIGLLAAMLLRLQGINAHVLDRSERGGFKSGLIDSIGAHHIDTREEPLSEFGPRAGPSDFIMEATGYAPLAFEASRHLAGDGLLCLVGVSGGSNAVTVDANEFNNNFVLGNRLLFGSVNANLVDFQAGVDHIRQINHRWPKALESMITRRIPFSQFSPPLSASRET